MHKIKKYYYTISIILLFIYAGNLLSGFNNISHSTETANNIDSPFAGSASCKSCHKDIFESHIKTAHYLTSGPGTSEYIKGSFAPGKNKFTYNKFMNVVLEKKDNGFFETAYMNGFESESEPINIVIGSGRKGQTYLYWNGNKLFQLPVSYYTTLQSWCNSPGYPTNFIRYNRIVPARCLECHGTYAKTTEDSDSTTIFDTNGIIYGVDCERCHGPAAMHVSYHITHPSEKKAAFIINPKKLSREQQLDACALCHSGLRKPIKPAFSFMEGDKLDEFSSPNYNIDTAAALDVHGNQNGLLTASKCFRSGKMNCSSCHNVHKEEVNAPALFSQHCMSCHNEASHNICKLTNTITGFSLGDNCIDCHMPLLPSNKIFLQLDDPKKSTPDFVRTHRIAVYPLQTKEYMEKMKKLKNPGSR
jgi:hypothetical protein